MKILMIMFLLIFSTVKSSYAFFLPITPIQNAYIDGPQSFGPRYYQGLTGGASTPFNQGEGVANYFSLDHAYHVTAIESFVETDRLEYPDYPYPVGFTFVLYSASLNTEHQGFIPDVASKIFEQSFLFNIDHTDTYRGVSGFDITLQPGDYWLGMENGTHGLIATSNIRFAAHAPEPCTLLLLGSGLTVGFFKRRRNVAHGIMKV